MNDSQIKCFLAAAKFENFTKAAESLYISQPVVGRHISNLEEELGFRLFIRDRKTVRLTENGRVFQAFLLECEEKYSAVMEQIHRNLRSNNMSLIIGSVEGQQIGDTYAAAFRYLVDNMPNLSVTIKYYLNRELIEAVRSGAVDAGIIDLADVGDDNAFAYKKIKELRTCLVVPTSHPMAAKRDPTIDDFKNDRFILLSQKDSESATELQRTAVRKLGITQFIEAPDVSTLAAWAAAGVGITTIPENHKLCHSPETVAIEIPELTYRFTEVLLWNRKNANPAIPAFCEVLDAAGYRVED
ncbi:MAG: LysR family transcriptional regulator [Oscillospiraceae bacterium]|nr:LysR family transcriptional regulator [Oscillospiraceae bacterium]